MREFFGLTEELPPGLDEVELLRTYRRNLKDRCGLEFAADLAVPHPTHQRTWFRLVIGGSHREVLRVFRDVEHTVLGREASEVRDGAMKRSDEQRTGQMALTLHTAPAIEQSFAEQHRADKASVAHTLRRNLEAGPREYGQLWPALLEDHHVTLSELGQLALDAEAAGQITIERTKKGSRARPKDQDRLTATRAASPLTSSSGA